MKNTILLFILSFSVQSIFANALWVPVEASPSQFESLDWNLKNSILQEQIVFWDAQKEIRPSMELTLFDRTLEVEFSHRERHIESATSWIGRVANDEMSYVVITRYGDTQYGKIWLSDGTNYLIQPTRIKNHCRVVQYLSSSFDCFYQSQTTSGTPAGNDNLCEDEEWCESAIIDVMSSYTVSAASHLGFDDEQVKAGIVTAIVGANAVNQNSETTFSYRLIYAEPVDFVETESFMEDFEAFNESNDGIMDDLYTIRNDIGADLMNLLLGDEGGSGGSGR